MPLNLSGTTIPNNLEPVLRIPVWVVFPIACIFTCARQHNVNNLRSSNSFLWIIVLISSLQQLVDIAFHYVIHTIDNQNLNFLHLSFWSTSTKFLKLVSQQRVNIMQNIYTINDRAKRKVKHVIIFPCNNVNLYNFFGSSDIHSQ